MKFNLQLTVDEGQQVLNVLVKEPYIEVVDIINNIQSQAAVQMEIKQKEEDKVEKEAQEEIK